MFILNTKEYIEPRCFTASVVVTGETLRQDASAKWFMILDTSYLLLGMSLIHLQGKTSSNNLNAKFDLERDLRLINCSQHFEVLNRAGYFEEVILLLLSV